MTKKSWLGSSEYNESLSEEDKKFIKQFDQEYHYGSRPKNPIIKDKNMRKEADRNNNARQTDALEQGYLENLDQEGRQFMEDASDEWDWKNYYKIFGRIETIEYMIKKAMEELKVINPKVALLRFHNRVKDLEKYHRKTKKDKK